MKTRTAMMIAVILITVQITTAAEPAVKFTSEEKKISFAIKNLIVGIHSSNPGVIESAMRVAAQMKMLYPQSDVTELMSGMNDIFQNNPSGTLRYKAYVAMSVCQNPEWYLKDTSVVKASEEKFFIAASARMQEELLSENIK